MYVRTYIRMYVHVYVRIYVHVCVYVSCSQRGKSTHSMHSDGQVPCLFSAKLQIVTDSLFYEPPHAEFMEGIEKILSWFKNCILGKPTLLPDPFFHSFTRYILYVCTYVFLFYKYDLLFCICMYDLYMYVYTCIFTL